MSNVYANIQVNINTATAVKNLATLQAKAAALSAQINATNASSAGMAADAGKYLQAAAASTGAFTARILPATTAVDSFNQHLMKNKFSMGDYAKYSMSASKSVGFLQERVRGFNLLSQRSNMINEVASQRVKALATQYVQLGASVTGAQQVMALTPAILNKNLAGQQMALEKQRLMNMLIADGSTKMLNWGKNMQWAGRQLMVGFTLPLTLFAGIAISVFNDMEKQALEFKKVYGDLFTTEPEMQQNLQAVKDLGLEFTKYGIAIKDTMKMATTAAAAGQQNADLIAATTEATRLQVLGQMEGQDAMATTISLQTAFKMSNEQLTESINFLNAVENQTVLTLQDVTEAIPRVATVINSFGGGVEELSVLLVAMKEGGVSAAEGANALKNSLARLITPTKAAREMTSAFGIDLEAIVKNNRGQLIPMLTELGDELNKLGGTQKQEVLSTLFGKYQYARIGTMLQSLTTDASQASRAIDLTSATAVDLAKTAERELGRVESSTSTKAKATMEKLKSGLVPIGEEFLKAAMPILEFLGDLIKKFNEFPDRLKQALVSISTVVGIIAPVVLMMTGLFANLIAQAIKGIQLLRRVQQTIMGQGKAWTRLSLEELEASSMSDALRKSTVNTTGALMTQAETITVLNTQLKGYVSLLAEAAALSAAFAGKGMPGAVGKGRAAKAPKPANFNTGGNVFDSRSNHYVPGVGNTDTVPAILTPGEFVVNKEATKNNLPILHAINNGEAVNRNRGGMIPGVQYFARNRPRRVVENAPEIKTPKPPKSISLNPTEQIPANSPIQYRNEVFKSSLNTEITRLNSLLKSVWSKRSTPGKRTTLNPQGLLRPPLRGRKPTVQLHHEDDMGLTPAWTYQQRDIDKNRALKGRVFVSTPNTFASKEASLYDNEMSGLLNHELFHASKPTAKYGSPREMGREEARAMVAQSIAQGRITHSYERLSDRLDRRNWTDPSTAPRLSQEFNEEILKHVTRVQRTRGDDIAGLKEFYGTGIGTSRSQQSQAFNEYGYSEVRRDAALSKIFDSFIPISKTSNPKLYREITRAAKRRGIPKELFVHQVGNREMIQTSALLMNARAQGSKPFNDIFMKLLDSGLRRKTTGLEKFFGGRGSQTRQDPMDRNIVNQLVDDVTNPSFQSIRDNNLFGQRFNKGGMIHGVKYPAPGGKVSQGRLGYGVPSRLLAKILEKGSYHQGVLPAIGTSNAAKVSPLSSRMESVGKENAWGPSMYTSPSPEGSGMYRFIYRDIDRRSLEKLNMYRVGWDKSMPEMAMRGELKFYDHSNPAHRRKLSEELGFTKSDKPVDGVPYFTKSLAPDIADLALHSQIKSGALLKLGYDAAYFPMSAKSEIYKRGAYRGINKGRPKDQDFKAYKDLFGSRDDLGEFTIISDRLTPKYAMRDMPFDSAGRTSNLFNSATPYYNQVTETIPSYHRLTQAEQQTAISERFKGIPSTRFKPKQTDTNNPTSRDNLGLLFSEQRRSKQIKANDGKLIPGIGSTDTVPAMLTPGEFVVNKQATQSNLSLLHAINDGKTPSEIQGFNKGGQISGMQYFATENDQRVVQSRGEKIEYLHAFDHEKIQPGSKADKIIKRESRRSAQERENARALKAGQIPEKVAGPLASHPSTKEMRMYSNVGMLGPKRMQHGATGAEYKSLFTPQLMDRTMTPFYAGYAQAIAGGAGVGKKAINKAMSDPAVKESVRRLGAHLGQELGKFGSAVVSPQNFRDIFKSANLKETNPMMHQAYTTMQNPTTYGANTGQGGAHERYTLTRAMQDQLRQAGLMPKGNAYTPSYLNWWSKKGGLTGLGERVGVIRKPETIADKLTNAGKGKGKKEKTSLISQQPPVPPVVAPVSQAAADDNKKEKKSKKVAKVAEQESKQQKKENKKNKKLNKYMKELGVPGVGPTPRLAITAGPSAYARTSGGVGIPTLQGPPAGQIGPSNRAYAQTQLLAIESAEGRQARLRAEGMRAENAAIRDQNKLKVTDRKGLPISSGAALVQKPIGKLVSEVRQARESGKVSKRLESLNREAMRQQRLADLRAKSQAQRAAIQQTTSSMLPSTSGLVGRVLAKPVGALRRYAMGDEQFRAANQSSLNNIGYRRFSQPQKTLKDGTRINIRERGLPTLFGEAIKPALRNLSQQINSGTTALKNSMVTGASSLGKSMVAGAKQLSAKILSGSTLINNSLVSASKKVASPFASVVGSTTSSIMGLGGRMKQGLTNYNASWQDRTPSFLRSGAVPVLNEQGEPIRDKKGKVMTQKQTSGLKKGSGRAAGGIGAAGMMLSMAPMFMQDDKGKFLGMDPMAAMGGIMGISMAAGGLKAMITSGVAAISTAGIALGVFAGIAAVAAVSLKLWRESVDGSARAAAELGANLGGTANAVNKMAQVIGVDTPAQRQAKMQMGFTNDEQKLANDRFGQMLSSDEGKAFVGELKGSNTAQRVTKVKDYVQAAIATKQLSVEDAKLFTKTLATALGDPILGTAVVGSITSAMNSTDAMKTLADKRLAAVTTVVPPNIETAIDAIKNAPAIGTEGFQKSIATDVSAFAIGSAVQVIQDYSNVIAVTREQYQQGIITFEKYNSTVTRATAIQNEYAGVLSKAVGGAYDMQGARQALDSQLVAGGMSQEQVDALTHATDIGVSGGGIITTLFNAFGQGGVSAYQSDFIARGANKMGISDSQLTPDQLSKLKGEAQASEEAAKKMFEGGLNEDLKALVLAGKATADQAAALGQQLMENSKGAGATQYQKMQEQGQGILGLEQAGFIDTSNTLGVTGLKGKDKLQEYIDVGINFSTNGGSLAEYQTFFNSLPEGRKQIYLDILANTTYKGQTSLLAGATSLTGIYGEEAAGRMMGTAAYLNTAGTTKKKAVTLPNGKKDPLGLETEDTSQYDSYSKAIATVGNKLGAETGEKVKIAAEATFTKNGKKATGKELEEEILRLGDSADYILKTLPEDVLREIGIDFTDPEKLDHWNSVSHAFTDGWSVLSQLNPNVSLSAVIEFLTLDADGKRLSPEDMAENTILINNAMNDLENSKDVTVRKQAYVQMGIAGIKDSEGNPIDESVMNSEIDSLVSEFGGKVLFLPETTLVGAVKQIYDASQLREKANKLMENPSTANITMANELNSQADILEGTGKGTIRTGLNDLKNSKSGGGGGGDKKETPIKDMNKGFLDQIKMYTNMDANLKKLNAARGKFAESLLKGKGIIQKLREAGVSEGIISSLAAKGFSALQKGYKQFVSKGKVNDLGKNENFLARSSAITAATGGIEQAIVNAQNQTTAARRMKNMRGTSKKAKGLSLTSEELTTALSDPELQDAFAKIDTKKGRNEIQKYINKVLELRKINKDAARELDPRQSLLDDMGIQAEYLNAEIASTEALLTKASRDKFAAEYGMTKDQAELQMAINQQQIDAIQREIDKKQESNNLDQHSIDLLEHGKKQWQDKIDLIQESIDGYQKSIDTYQRENEMRNQQTSIINHSLDIMSQKEDDITTAYNKRVDALDQVAKINDYLINQQKSQLSLADALSRGDIGAAAGIQQDMRATDAQFATEEMRTGLQTGMENQIAGLTTEGGLTRLQAEAELNRLKELSYQNDLLITSAQNEIYNKTQAMLPYKTELEKIDKNIATYTETIWQRNNDIYNIENGKLKSLQDNNKELDTRLKMSDDQLKIDIMRDTLSYQTQLDSLDIGAKQIELSMAQEAAVGLIGKRWENVLDLIIAANKALKEGETEESKLRALAATNPKDAAALIKKADDLAKGTKKTYEDTIKKIGEMKPVLSSAAKEVPEKKAAGGIIGTGGRDSIPAMLTPGEFIMRKASVQKYGTSMLSRMNIGSFEMPRYDVSGRSMSQPTNAVSTSTNINAPVYNTYSVNVNVPNTNADPSMIADKVIMRMSQIDNANIRSVRGNK